MMNGGETWWEKMKRSMLSKLAMLACVAGASAALELTPENYDKEVTASGKAAFIKFLAPW